MASHLGCIAGEDIYRQFDAGQLLGDALGPQSTPFGPSGELFRITLNDRVVHFLPRHRPGLEATAPGTVNHRANLYALKDVGVDHVLGWGPGGAITHNIAVGDLVVLSDLTDLTTRTQRTFFEDSPLGRLRQFPVFCPALRILGIDVLQEMKLVHHATGVAAVREGPRMATPAEVRMLSTFGAEITTCSFAPELFLARELQMGYIAVCYVTHYADTGSRHRPFHAGGLFGGLHQETEADRLDGAVGALHRICASLIQRLDATELDCACTASQQHHIEQYNLPADWRTWFDLR